jgi:hypothetical protein
MLKSILQNYIQFNGTSCFCIFIESRGHHRKRVAIFNADYVNFQPKPWFSMKRYVFLNTTERSKQ